MFTYQTEDLKLQLSQAKLEMEEMGNEIGNYNSQIKSLKSEKASAPKEGAVPSTRFRSRIWRPPSVSRNITGRASR